MARIARDPRYFTYLQDCAPEAQIVLGDGRLSLSRESTPAYDLIVLDAYSSDAIPVHLITREALAVYLGRLSPHGTLAFHISNKHLDLEHVLGNLARDAGLAALSRNDEIGGGVDREKYPSHWLVMARSLEALGPLARDRRWETARADAEQAVWTDQFSSLLSVLRW